VSEIDNETGEVLDAYEPPQPPKLPPLDMSHATPGLFAALAAAQARVGTVAKDGTNKHGGYDYATADSMIRGAREARAGTGLALLTTWSFSEIAGEADGDGQWPCAIVTMHFVLAHESGGWLSGKLSMHAIGSRRRPPDKAIAAAATYAEGFIERGLMRLDRADEGDDDVERREECDTRSAPRQQRPAQKPQQAQQNGQPTLASILAGIKDAAALDAWLKKHGARVRSSESRDAVIAHATKLGCVADDEHGEVSSYAWVTRRLGQIMTGTEAA
jgi:hypothetical protein